MPATLTITAVDRLLCDLGYGEVVAATETHTLAQLDADTFVCVGDGPTDGAWLTEHLPAGRAWVTEWDTDGDALWVWITAE